MHEHLTRELFRAVATGWRNPGDLAGIALSHLFELCPDCRRDFESWRQELADDSGTPESADYDAVIDRIRARVERAPHQREAPIRSEIRQARSRAEQLLRLDPEQQAEWVRTESTRFAGPILAEVLIEEARRRTPAYPHAGFTLSHLARLVLQHLPSSCRATALYARSLAHMANAVRVTGDLSRAEQLLGDARYLLRGQGGGSRLVRAELDHLEGSLRINQESLERALPLLLRTLMVCRLEGADSEVVAVLINLARLHNRLDDAPRALVLLAEAEQILESAPDPWLSLILLDNRAWSLCLSGEPELALEVFESCREFAEQRDDPLYRLRRRWTRAKICRRLGDRDSAEQDLVSVRNGFLDLDIRPDAALAALDLASLYLEQRRYQQAEELAEDALCVFEEVHLPSQVSVAQDMRKRAAAGRNR